MSIKKIGRIICCTVMAAAVSAAAALSGCTIETKHPRAEITIEFDGTEYVIEYTLYRNMYPQTVRHFIELAEEGFYDNTIIHDYATNDWFGGGYDYDADAYAEDVSSEDMDNYLEEYDKAEEYIDLFYDGKLTASVYKNYTYEGDEMVVDEDTAYWTLRGEFSNNGHTIDNGALTASFGVLKMYYTEKAYDDEGGTYLEENAYVYLKTSNDETVQGKYEYNSATSLFAIQVGSSSDISASYYCVFAQLRNDDAEDTLNDLLDAIEDYVGDLGDTDFVQSASVIVDQYDEFAGPTTTDYSVPIDPTIIKSVKITRY